MTKLHSDKRAIRKYSLKKVFFILFIAMIVIPILSVLAISLLILNRQFQQQAIENIQQSQETVAEGLRTDIDNMSLRLSHLIHVNDNEVLSYAAEADTINSQIRYESQQKLFKAQKLTMEPVEDILSVYFYMKDGKNAYMKNSIKWTQDEVQQKDWYHTALENRNEVIVGMHNITGQNDLITSESQNMLILTYALAPDISTDRSQKLEMVVLYQNCDEANRIKKYNREYLQGKNKLGLTQITDSSGSTIYSTDDTADFKGKCTYVRTPVTVNRDTWYIESIIPTAQLTKDYWKTASLILLTAIAVLTMACFFLQYFLRSLIRPVEQLSQGMKQIEEGSLDVHITPSGQSEVRNLIHQFNALVRWLKRLIDEYERKVQAAGKSMQYYLKAIVRGTMSPEEVAKESPGFFSDPYIVIGMYVDEEQHQGWEQDSSRKLMESFGKNPRFASRCLIYNDSARFFIVLYRVAEEDYSSWMEQMVHELQKIGDNEFGVRIFASASDLCMESSALPEKIQQVRRTICLRHLGHPKMMLNLEKDSTIADTLCERMNDYTALANALYIADEKNVTEEKEKLFGLISEDRHEGILAVLSMIIAIGERFGREHCSLVDIFGQRYNYPEKLKRLEDEKGLKMWLTNYLAWILDYCSSRLEISQSDVIVRAKHYVLSNYTDSNLTLGSVAEYVGLSEKYLTNRFTHESGETFSDYLTGIRLQKAKELLKTTSFKVYKIAEMVGYNNTEHFNRMFKKNVDMSPSQFRKL